MAEAVPTGAPPVDTALTVAPVTVVIVNHNAGRLLVECLESVLEAAAEVVLVDNASEPEPFESLLAPFADHPRLEVVRSPDNRGFAAGCNLGAEFSTQPFVLFLNPDCVVRPGALGRLCDALAADPEAALAGGRLTYADGREQGGGRRAVPTPWRSFVRAFGLARLSRRWPRLFNDFHLHFEPLPREPIAVEAISGACMLVSRRAMNVVGLMDEGYFLHCEDLDLCMRVRREGWRILFVPDSQIVHYKGGCSVRRPVFVEWHKHKGMVRFYKKHFRLQYPTGLMELVIVGVWLRFAVLATRHGAVGLARRLGEFRRRRSAGSRPLESAVLPVVVSTRPLTS